MRVLNIFLLLAIMVFSTATTILANNKISITAPVDDKVLAAAAQNGKANVAKSPYYIAVDYYNKKPTQTILLLPKFKTYQQTSERSCGAATILMVLDYYGIKADEKTLDKQMDIRYYDNKREDGSFGATTKSLADALTSRGFIVQTSLQTADKDGHSFQDIEKFRDFVKNQLSQGLPIICENVAWGGHWFVVIGYDDMGTEDMSDDILVIADPYDTTDHNQDGYGTISFARFFYEWFDYNVLPKTEHIQQYVAVTGLPSKK